MPTNRDGALEEVTAILEQMKRLYVDFGVDAHWDEQDDRLVLVVDGSMCLPVGGSEDHEDKQRALNALESDLLVGRLRLTLERLSDISARDPLSMVIYRKYAYELNEATFDPFEVEFAGAVASAITSFASANDAPKDAV